jgi:hypothetical protein
VEGPHKLVGVMWRDGARYAATGGWGFEARQGYVFSALRP